MTATTHEIRPRPRAQVPKKSHITVTTTADIDFGEKMAEDYQATFDHVLKGCSSGRGFYVSEIRVCDGDTSTLYL